MKTFFSMPKLALLFCSAIVYIPEAGAEPKKNPTKKTYSGSFALITAVRDGNLEEVKRLLNTNAVNINQQTSENAQNNIGGNTALHIAVERLRKGPINGPYLPITLALIADHRINVSIPNKAGQVPLHLLAGITKEADKNFGQTEKSRPDLSQVAERLLLKGAQLNVKDKEGLTPLHRASIEGIPSLVLFFIRHNADINARTCTGQTALMKAAQKGHSQIIAQLIAAGADLNAQDPVKGRTALHWVQRMREGATQKAGKQISKERALLVMTQLVQAGADPTIKDFVTNDNPIARSPIDWAAIKSPWSVNNNPELELLTSAAKNVIAASPQNRANTPDKNITPRKAAIMLARKGIQLKKTTGSNIPTAQLPITRAPADKNSKPISPNRNTSLAKKVGSNISSRKKTSTSHTSKRENQPPKRTQPVQRNSTGRYRQPSHRVQTGHSPLSRRRVSFAPRPTIIPRKP